jgi:ketosteroid isomerase-like protein
VSTAEENKQLLQRIFEALARGDSRPLVEHMSDDFCWNVAGNNSWSKTFRGKAAVLGQLLTPLGARITGKMRTIGERFIAEGDYVVVEARGDNTTKSGVPYCNRYCFIFRLSNGNLREVTEYADTELVTRALGNLE